MGNCRLSSSNRRCRERRHRCALPRRRRCPRHRRPRRRRPPHRPRFLQFCNRKKAGEGG